MHDTSKFGIYISDLVTNRYGFSWGTNKTHMACISIKEMSINEFI